MSAVPRSYGTGPGVITPDGCAVDFYVMLPDFGEPAIVHEAAGPGASILELGCGAGRVTHPLIALGHQTFITTRLDEAGLTAALAAAGLRLDRYLTEDRSWFRAVPAIVPG